MKVRTDFVSNSSSSSFVLGQHEVYDHFGITKQDILDALIELYGGQSLYNKSANGRRKASHEHPDWYEKERKYNNFGPFWVYDLDDEKDRAEAIECWGNLLDGWPATNCHIVHNKDSEDDGHVRLGRESINNFNSVLHGVAELYDVSEWSLRDAVRDPSAEQPQRFVRSDKPDPETKMYGHYEHLDKDILDFLRKAYYDAGIMTNLDVIKSEVARFFIHADDNELVGGEVNEDQEKDGKQIWESEFCSYDRICEIIYKNLVKKGRIRPDDPEFLKVMEIDPKFLSKQEKIDGEIYDFCNGKNMTWKDIRHDSLTWNLHEG